MRPLIILVAVFVLSGCLRDESMNLSFVSYEPRDIDDGLVLSTPQDEGIDPEQLEEVFRSTYADENLWSLRSLLVFKNNRLVAEAYLKDEDDITTRHLIWSCTKQVMGVLTGVGGETDKVLRQIPDDITEFVLSRPMRNEPGTDFNYNDGDPQLISAILQRAAGKPADDWAQEVLFSRIGVSNYNWVRYKDGTSLGGFGIETTPREMAKIAMCVADSGRAGGQQIISAQWNTEMTSPQVEVSDDYSFGYYWWIDPARNIQFMWGHGGQFAFIVPDYRLIVIMSSIPNTQGDYQIQADEVLPVVDEIINACY